VFGYSVVHFSFFGGQPFFSFFSLRIVCLKRLTWIYWRQHIRPGLRLSFVPCSLLALLRCVKLSPFLHKQKNNNNSNTNNNNNNYNQLGPAAVVHRPPSPY